MPHIVKHILLPIDFSDNSELAMKTALHSFGDKVETITLLTVYEGAQKNNYGQPDSDNEIDAMMGKSANIEMVRFKRQFENSHSTIKTIVTKGNPAAEIIAAAKNIKADLIIMGSQGRNSIANVFFGGTTYQVSRKAHCSVYVIRK
jgi:glycine betaine transporter